MPQRRRLVSRLFTVWKALAEVFTTYMNFVKDHTIVSSVRRFGLVLSNYLMLLVPNFLSAVRLECKLFLQLHHLLNNHNFITY